MSGKQRRSRGTGFTQRGVKTKEAARDDAVRVDSAEPDPLPASDCAIRLGCLRAAIELRSAGSAPGELLVTAAAFYEFVTGARDDARERDQPSI